MRYVTIDEDLVERSRSKTLSILGLSGTMTGLLVASFIAFASMIEQENNQSPERVAQASNQIIGMTQTQSDDELVTASIPGRASHQDLIALEIKRTLGIDDQEEGRQRYQQRSSEGARERPFIATVPATQNTAKSTLSTSQEIAGVSFVSAALPPAKINGEGWVSVGAPFTSDLSRLNFKFVAGRGFLSNGELSSGTILKAKKDLAYYRKAGAQPKEGKTLESGQCVRVQSSKAQVNTKDASDETWALIKVTECPSPKR